MLAPVAGPGRHLGLVTGINHMLSKVPYSTPQTAVKTATGSYQCSPSLLHYNLKLETLQSSGAAWQLIPTCNLQEVQRHQNEGIPRKAFHSQRENNRMSPTVSVYTQVLFKGNPVNLRVAISPPHALLHPSVSYSATLQLLNSIRRHCST